MNWRARTTIVALAGAFALIPASAQAGVVTYTSTDVPKTVDDGINAVSTLAIPAGRTAVTDVDVASVQAFTPIGSGDRGITLTGPGGQFTLVAESGCNTFNFNNVSFDDEGPGNPYEQDVNCTPPAGSTLRPTNPLSVQDGAGTGVWTLRVFDLGNMLQAGEGQLTGWGLRVTHAPPTLTITTAKQKLGGAVTFTAVSNADGTLVTTGGIAPVTTQLAAGVPATIAGPLRKKLRKRLARKLAKGKKPKIALKGAFTDQTNGSAAASAAVPLKKSGKKKR